MVDGAQLNRENVSSCELCCPTGISEHAAETQLLTGVYIQVTKTGSTTRGPTR